MNGKEDLSMTPRSKDVNTFLKGIFREWDTNGDGVIEPLELTMVMKMLGGFNAMEIDAIMSQMDTSKNGLIEYDEFVNWMTKPDTIQRRRSVFDEEGPQLEALKAALLGLFHVYDRNRDGTVSIEEFKDCHSILQGALSAAPAENAKKRDPRSIMDDADHAFGVADDNHDGSMSFNEFVTWLQAAMDQSGLCSERLTELILKLTEVLEGVFDFAEEVEDRPIERGISAKEATELEDLAGKLAKYSRELFSRPASVPVCGEEDRSRYTNTWCEPAPGISIRRLMQRHMREPVPTIGVKFIDVEVVLCIPENLTAELEDGRRRRWLVKVVRHISYKNHRPKSSPDFYYAYESLQWHKLADSSEYDEAVATLAPELLIYAILLKEADFGTKLTWKKILAALKSAEDMAIMAEEASTHYQDYMRSFIIQTLREDGIKADDATANEYLAAEVELSPSAVMSGLCELGVVRENELWADG